MDRLKAWFSACVARAVASLPYAGRYRYSVVSCNWAAQTLDLSPLDEGQPPLTGVPMRTPGLQLDVAPGTEVLVGYAGLNPTRPEVTSFGNGATSILRVALLGQTTPAAFQGMAVQVTLSSAQALTLGLLSAAPGAPIAPPPAPTSVTLSGQITGGSVVITGG